MTLFLISVFSVLAISALCSLTEAGFYAVRIPYVRALAESGSPAGLVLERFKDRMDRPIAAILIVNTIANTAGAAIAGSQARGLFGESAVLWFSAIFTVAVLFFSEIVPKVLGVVYSQPVAKSLALPWAWIISGMSPVIWAIEGFTRLLKPNARVFSAPEDEVQQLIAMSEEEGSIYAYEARLVRNALALDDIVTRSIMTPRLVVKKLPDSMTLKQAGEQMPQWIHSRIPVYSADDPEVWTGLVLARDVLTGLAQDRFEETLGSLAKPLHFVSEKLPGHVLLKTFLLKKTHLFGVMNEYGDLTGIVTLEDVLEHLIGEEIVDEFDTAVDMQEVAQRRAREAINRRKE